MEEVDLGRARHRLLVGNRSGGSILEDLAELRRESKAVKDGIAANEERIESLERQALATKDSIDGFWRIRSRFISTFKRDSGYDLTPSEQLELERGSGSIPAREGDPVQDARLYTQGRRDDDWVFMTLYGLATRVVEKISGRHRPLLTPRTDAGAPGRLPNVLVLLRVYGTLRYSQAEKPYPPSVDVAFGRVRAILEDTEFQEDACEKHDSKLTRAYWAFMSAAKCTP